MSFLLVDDLFPSLMKPLSLQHMKDFITTYAHLAYKKRITYEAYPAYKEYPVLDLTDENRKAYFLIIGDYRIALILKVYGTGLYVGDGDGTTKWWTYYYSPDLEEAAYYWDFPNLYERERYPYIDGVLSLFEQLDHDLPE